MADCSGPLAPDTTEILAPLKSSERWGVAPKKINAGGDDLKGVVASRHRRTNAGSKAVSSCQGLRREPETSISTERRARCSYRRRCGFRQRACLLRCGLAGCLGAAGFRAGLVPLQSACAIQSESTLLNRMRQRAQVGAWPRTAAPENASGPSRSGTMKPRWGWASGLEPLW
jgi:hypothetical protein